jgi:glycosyltransferase involved in cell wall biosynthesis
MSNIKLPISAIVVGYNEAHLLDECLSSITFCDEILYFDLNSSDNSIEIATKCHAKVKKHDRVPGCEWIHSSFADKTTNEWVLITDPDEVIDCALVEELKDIFKNGLHPEVGAIIVPCVFYFKQLKLKGTAWGGVNNRVLIANNKRFDFSNHVHVGRNLKKGFRYLELSFTQANVVHHYWMQGYKKLFAKHSRYLKNEGEARYSIGHRTSFKEIAFEPWRQFVFSFITKKGHRDGLTGLFLSLFWAWYQTFALISLYKVQKKQIA